MPVATVCGLLIGNPVVVVVVLVAVVDFGGGVVVGAIHIPNDIFQSEDTHIGQEEKGGKWGHLAEDNINL